MNGRRVRYDGETYIVVAVVRDMCHMVPDADPSRTVTAPVREVVDLSGPAEWRPIR